MEEDTEWWNPSHPEYEETRTLELRQLILDKLVDKTTETFEPDIGYTYADETFLGKYWSDFDEGYGRDVVHLLRGKGFLLEFRICAGSSLDKLDDFLWIDYVEGDDLAKAWLTNPPERTAMTADTYLGKTS